MELLKALREIFPFESAAAFVAVAAVIGALLVGGLGLAVDVVYKKEKRREQEVARTEAEANRKPIIPKGAGVWVGTIPVPAPTPLSEEQVVSILAEIASKPAPPLRVEINGFAFQRRPSDEEEIAAKALPGGELTSTLSFRVHILNQSKTDRVSLKIRGFSIVPGWNTNGVVVDGLKMNLGPQEDTEGVLSIQMTPSEYATLTTGRHLKVLRIDDVVSGLSKTVTVPTTSKGDNRP